MAACKFNLLSFMESYDTNISLPVVSDVRFKLRLIAFCLTQDNSNIKLTKNLKFNRWIFLLMRINNLGGNRTLNHRFSLESGSLLLLHPHFVHWSRLYACLLLVYELMVLQERYRSLPNYVLSCGPWRYYANYDYANGLLKIYDRT